jgi:MFS family permease
MMENAETRKTIRVFAWASFLNDFGSDMIYPVWPLFVTTCLGANMAVLGLIDGLGEAFVSIAKAISGYWSDRIRKRKVFIWNGYFFGALSRVGYAFTTAWPFLIPFKIFDRVGKIRSAPRDALVADISTDMNRGRHFGLMKSMDNLGAVCGIVTCVILFQYLGYRTLFLLAAFPSLISVFLIYRGIRENKPALSVIHQRMTLRILDGPFRLFLILSSIFALGSFSYSFLLIYANQGGFRISFVPVLYLVFTVTGALIAYPVGKLSDRIGRKKLVMFSFLLWGSVCGIITMTTHPVAIVMVFILYGLHKGILETVQKTFVAELSPELYRATSLGLFQMAVGLCALPASLAAGILWERIDYAAPFYVSLGLTAIASLLLFFVRERKGAGCDEMPSPKARF